MTIFTGETTVTIIVTVVLARPDAMLSRAVFVKLAGPGFYVTMIKMSVQGAHVAGIIKNVSIHQGSYSCTCLDGYEDGTDGNCKSK